MRRMFWLAAILAALLNFSAFAQSTGTGTLNAVSFFPLPGASTIEIQTLDNSDQNLALARELTQALTARGYTLSDNAALILTIETHDEIGAWTTTDRRHVVELKSRQSEYDDDESQIKFNLFNSNTGGILNQGSSGTSIVTPSQYELQITIDSAEGGRRLWEGWAGAELGQSDSYTLMRGMIPALADAIGKSVTRQTFPIQ